MKCIFKTADGIEAMEERNTAKAPLQIIRPVYGFETPKPDINADVWSFSERRHYYLESYNQDSDTALYFERAKS